MADKGPVAEQQLSQATRNQSLRRPLRWAIGIHVVIIVVSFIGLPHYRRPLDLTKAVNVDLVAPTADTSAAPNTTKHKQPFKPQAKPEQQKQPSKTEPKPEPPKPTPAAKSDDAKQDIVPKPEEQKLEKPKEPPKKEAPKQADKKVKLDKPKEKKKKEEKKEEAKQPEEFNSVLKNLLGAPDPQVTQPEGNPIDEILDQTKDVEGSAPTTSDILALSEMDALKYQLKRCWNVPAGAMNAEDLVVDIRVEVNPDRTVRTAEIVDQSRYNSDDFFRAAADSAKRALYNPLCTPLALPPEKYDLWKNMLITFNPRDMFGG